MHLFNLHHINVNHYFFRYCHKAVTSNHNFQPPEHSGLLTKSIALVIYTRCNTNHGFTQAVGLMYSIQEGYFHQINVLPLLALGPLNTVYKNKCLDKRFS